MDSPLMHLFVLKTFAFIIGLGVASLWSVGVFAATHCKVDSDDPFVQLSQQKACPSKTAGEGSKAKAKDKKPKRSDKRKTKISSKKKKAPKLRPTIHPSDVTQPPKTKAQKVVPKQTQNPRSIHSKGDTNDVISVSKGSDVFVVSELQCQPDAHFIRGWWSTVENVDTQQATVRRREHIAVLANYELITKDGKPDKDSVWYGDFWCIPKRAWCYQTVADNAFGSKNRSGESALVDLANISPLRHGFINAFKQVLENACEKDK